MKTRDYFVVVRLNSDSERIEKWSESDIRLFVKTLREERNDLHEKLRTIMLSNEECAKQYSPPNEEKNVFVEEPSIVLSKGNLSFDCKLEAWQFERLAEVANAERIFVYPVTITGETLEAFFFLKGGELRVRNLRLFCALMSALSNYGFIKSYWQAPIYKGRLLRAYEKDGYVNRSDLTTANHAINSVHVDERVARIRKAVKGLKEQRR